MWSRIAYRPPERTAPESATGTWIGTDPTCRDAMRSSSHPCRSTDGSDARTQVVLVPQSA